MIKPLLLIMLCMLSVLSDPFSILPGSKAKGMGGAYASIVDSTTAAYYNPAGYVDFFHNGQEKSWLYTLEHISIVSYNNFNKEGLENQLKTTDTSYFGYSRLNGVYGIGLSFIPIYTNTFSDRLARVDNTYLTDSSDFPTHLYTELDFFYQKVDMLYVGGAYKLWDFESIGNTLSIGTGLGVVILGGDYGTDTKKGKLKQYADVYREKPITIPTGKDVLTNTYTNLNYIGALGLKLRLFNTDDYAMSTGISYRSSSKPSIVSPKAQFVAGGGDIKGHSILTIPAWGFPAQGIVGISGVVKKSYALFSLAYDVKKTAYESVTDGYQSDVLTHALGFEASFPTYATQWRTGYYQSIGEGDNNINSQALTSGISFIYNGYGDDDTSALLLFFDDILKNMTFDISFEKKSFSKKRAKTALHLISISMNYVTFEE